MHIKDAVRVDVVVGHVTPFSPMTQRVDMHPACKLAYEANDKPATWKAESFILLMLALALGVPLLFLVLILVSCGGAALFTSQYH